MKLFVDLDGVMADFDTHHERVFGIRSHKFQDNVNWKAVRAVKDFYLNIPPMPDAFELWNAVKHLDPHILTGIPSDVEEAAQNKRDWVFKHLGQHVHVICCRSKDKSLHAEAGDVLIDDWEKYKHLWVAKGGVWITHMSAKESIQQLAQVMHAGVRG